MTDQPNRKVLQRDTLSLKREVDEALGEFAERLLAKVPRQHHPTMEAMDAVVDDVSGNIIRPIAKYVKRQFRRYNVSVDDISGASADADSDDDQNTSQTD